MSLLDSAKELKLKEYGIEYKDFKEKEGNIVISPSSLNKFISNRGEWYRNIVLKQNDFNGNEKTVLGSLLHQFAEDFFNGDLTKEGKLQKWKLEQIAKDYDVISDFERVYPILENYLSSIDKPIKMEQYLEYDIRDNIKLAGSYDFLTKENGKYILGDYKSSNRAFRNIDNYILQLSIYCLLLELTDSIKVDLVRVVGIITTKEPKIIILEQEPNIELAKKILNDIIYSLDLVSNNKDLVDIIFQYNYFDMFSDKRIIDTEPTYKEHSINTIKAEKIKSSIFSWKKWQKKYVSKVSKK